MLRRWVVGSVLAALLLIALVVAAFWFLIRADSVEYSGSATTSVARDAVSCNQETTTVDGISSFSARFIRSEIPLPVYEGRVTIVYITPFDPPQSWPAINLRADRGVTDIAWVAQVHGRPNIQALFPGDCLRITGKLAALDCGPACDAAGFVADSIDVIAE